MRLLLIVGFLSLIGITQAIQAATLNVPSSQYPTIQSAVNAANGGDTIVLQAGTTFTESVVLKYKSGSAYITIQSSALSNLPTAGQRVGPSHAQYMPRVVPTSSSSAFSTEITTNGPSHHYKLIGIEMVQTSSLQLTYDMVSLGSSDSDQNSLDKVAHHFVIDRCYIHGHPNGELKRGIALNSLYTDVLNSYISEIHVTGQDSQAIAGYNGPGQYLIENNYLEAASENILFGGNDPQIPNLVPSDIEIRHNLITKNVSWYGGPSWNIKNILELKNARRIAIVGNILENNWAAAQQGYGILFTVRNQSGNAPWSTIEDVNFSYNIVRNTPAAIAILGQDYKYPSQNVKNLNISYNLISSVSTIQALDSQFGKCVQLSGNPSGSIGTQNLTLNHNTCIGKGNYPAFLYGDSDSSTKATGLDVKNNIAMGVISGTDTSIDGNGAPFAGTPALDAMAGTNAWSLQKNILMLPSGSSTYPNSGTNINYYVNNSSSVGFVDFANGNYALTSSSTYHNVGTDGTDPGANISLLNQKKPCIESGNWSSYSSATQLSYPGANAQNIPTTLEVENFDKGGQSVAYNDTFGSTGSSAYRPNPIEAVDVYAYSNASNGYAVYEAAAGEWLEYTINVPFTRTYDIGFRYASQFNNGTYHLEDCGSDPQNQSATCTNLTGTMTVSSTGNWNSFRVNTKRGVQLTAGTHVLRLKMDANSPDMCGCVVGNFDAILFKPTLFDYDNDGRADVSLFRPSNSNLYIDQSTAGFTGVTFGFSTDIIAPGDFDGDGRTDVSVFRPSNGTWYRLNSSNSSSVSVAFGASGDIPVQADYDGDGKTDVAVFRPSTGAWYYLKSSNGTSAGGQFGQSGDKPAVGDFEGDGKSDLAIFRPSTGFWYIFNSSTGVTTSLAFGASTDTITPADYDGDGKTDIAVFRSSNSTWYLQRSQAGFTGVAYGSSSDIPSPADYDGDGKADIASFRPSTGTWSIIKSTEGSISQVFGVSGDIPVPSTYVR